MYRKLANVELFSIRLQKVTSRSQATMSSSSSTETRVNEVASKATQREAFQSEKVTVSMQWDTILPVPLLPSGAYGIRPCFGGKEGFYMERFAPVLITYPHYLSQEIIEVPLIKVFVQKFCNLAGQASGLRGPWATEEQWIPLDTAPSSFHRNFPSLTPSC